MQKLVTISGSSLLLLLPYAAIAADAAITLAPGGSFVINNSTGSQQLLILNQSGELRINGRQADFTPPTISANVPEIATGHNTAYKFYFADNSELGFFVRGEYSPDFLEKGVKEAEVEFMLPVELGGGPQNTNVVASDTSGNLEKKLVTISPPDIPYKIGDYKIISEIKKFPIGFDCLPEGYGGFDFDNQEVSNISTHVSYYQGIPGPPEPPYWSVVSGFAPGIFLITKDNNYSYYLGSSTPELVPLNGTLFDMDSPSGSGGGNGQSYQTGFQAQVRVQPNYNPTRIEIDINMKCKFDDADWIKGVTASFTAEFVSSPSQTANTLRPGQ
jgi:hypothetical protein